MELFNYIHRSGYERESPFVNDVKFHPVLKARKSFASGILAAFISSDSSGNSGRGQEGEKQSSGGTSFSANEDGNRDPGQTTTSLFGKLKKQVGLK